MRHSVLSVAVLLFSSVVFAQRHDAGSAPSPPPAPSAIPVNEIKGLKAQMQKACSQNPLGQHCDDLKLRQTSALQRYQMLLSEAGPNCWARLADPASLD